MTTAVTSHGSHTPLASPGAKPGHSAAPRQVTTTLAAGPLAPLNGGAARPPQAGTTSAPRARLPHPSAHDTAPPRPTLQATRASAAWSHAQLLHRMQRLVGASIDPAMASALLEEAGEGLCPVVFDGIGRITEFAEAQHQDVSAELIARLESAVIKPLTLTPSHAPREAPRAERDLLVRAMHVLKLYNSAENAALLAQAKELFLSAHFSRDALAALLEQGVERLAGDVLLQDQIEKLHQEALKPVTMTQRIDNLYGRTFESLLVEDLVLDPPPGVLKVAHELGLGIMSTLTALAPAEQDALAAELKTVLSGDERPWYVHSPSLKAYARSPSLASLAACLADTSNGLEAIKVLNIAQRFVLAINNVSGRGDMARPPWYAQCVDFYSDFLRPLKPQTETPMAVEAQNPGTWLRHQPNASRIQNPARGINWTHYRMPDPKDLSVFEQSALLSGHSVINGPSGQTCMLAFLGQELARHNPALSLAKLHLATLMGLVFDGGHSTEEVLFTLSAIHSFHSPQSRPQAWNNGYEAIMELGESQADKQALRERLDRAVDRTVAYCAEHVA